MPHYRIKVLETVTTVQKRGTTVVIDADDKDDARLLVGRWAKQPDLDAEWTERAKAVHSDREIVEVREFRSWDIGDGHYWQWADDLDNLAETSDLASALEAARLDEQEPA